MTMAHSNREILSAVLAKWGQPAIESIAGGKLMQLPFLANLEAKIKATGWVSPMWSMSKELAPLMGGISSQVITPLLANYLKDIPDEAIPRMAHSIVENAIKNGGISLMEGNVVFEEEDMVELQKLLRYNLPVTESEEYQVKLNE